MPGAIDVLCNHFTPESIAKNYSENVEESGRFEQFGLMHKLVGDGPEDFMRKMAEIGVDKLLIPSILTWSYWDQVPVEHSTPEEVIALCEMFPDRIYGLYGINPRTRMEGVRTLERLVKDHNFKGVHLHPHGFGYPPNHRNYFPFYAKCAELDVPVVISMGHTLDLMPIENGRPIHLDDIALYFPDLKIVCAHTGWPWAEEAISVAWKHPNIYIATSAYKPKYWSPPLVKFINSHGQGKVMWGTDFPLIHHEEALVQIEGIGFKESAKSKLLFEVAEQVFGI